VKRIKTAILIAIILIGGIVLVSLWANLRERRASEAIEKLPKISTGGADMRLEKIRFVEDKHGQKTWELEAKSVDQYQGRNMIVLEDVKVTFLCERRTDLLPHWKARKSLSGLEKCGVGGQCGAHFERWI
jgi:hypothetical protein